MTNNTTDDKYQGEEILVLPTLLFHELGYFEGFSDRVKPYLDVLLNGSHTRFMRRIEAEDDPSFKQLIPYCLFKFQDQLFVYRRGKGIGEGRLLGKRSVGIGGHISLADTVGSDHPYYAGMQREIEEEIEINTTFNSSIIIGLINDDQSEVGRVHLGVVHLMELSAPEVAPLEDSIQECGFEPISALHNDTNNFESWSQICLNYLVNMSN